MSDEKKKKNTKNKETNDSRKKCFLITPIGGKNSVEFKKLEALEKNVYKVILDEFNYELVIAHKINEAGSIGDQVFKSILSADLIIANMTGLNANVMYEVAVAHSFGIPTVMISENDTRLPFDLISERTIFYDDTIEGCGHLITELRTKIRHLTEDGNSDNPIYRVVERTMVTNDITGSVDKSEISQRVLFEIQDQLSSLARQLNNSDRSKLTKNMISTKSNVDNQFGTQFGNYHILLPLESKLGLKVLHTIDELSTSLDRRLNYEELAAELNISVEDVKRFVIIS